VLKASPDIKETVAIICQNSLRPPSLCLSFMTSPACHFTGFVRVDISGKSPSRRTTMGYKETMIEEYKKTDPEFVKMIEEAEKRFAVADAITNRRIEMGLSRRSFARVLGISERDLYRLERADFWKSREETETWINQAFNSLNSKLSQPK
jgi:hypothetical protein